MRRLLGSGLITAFVLLLAACSGPLKYSVPSTRLAPGADSEIVADVNESQNQTVLEFKAKNLPPPARVNPAGTMFVAWQRKNSNGPWARLGTVKFDESARTAEITATVPEQAFDFQVSVEANEAAQSPSSDVVFSQRVAR
jgi:hypothetical protein